MNIFMMSSRRDAESVFRARNCGIHYFIAKPYSLQTMRDRIYTTLIKPREFIRAENYVGPDRRLRERDGNEGQKPLIATPEILDMTGEESAATTAAEPKSAAVG